MKCMRISDSGQGRELTENDVDQPKPREGEVLVRLHAAGVTPTEAIWYPTLHTNTGAPRMGAVPAHEFSGSKTGR